MGTINFKELGIQEELLRGIEDLGFEYPMPIQEKVIPVILQKEGDLVGLAQTGTGKTAAFGLPLIQKIDQSSQKCQLVVICPTRELCLQITNDLQDYTKYLKNIGILAIYGGASIEVQARELKRNPQVIVATPGRLLDFLQRGNADISHIRSLVLDEADEMLNMGFKEELTAILEQTPQDKNTYLFSATMPKEIAEIAGNYMKDPIEIMVGERNVGADNVSHIYYTVSAKNRYPVLKRIADYNPDIYGIIFCRTRMETKEIAAKLINDGYNADALHGDLSQGQRDYVMHKFRSKTLQMLVATDVAARGIDVSDLTHIINYNLPDEILSYTHRSGRTGRAGKTGVSIAIIHQKEKFKIKRIEKIIGKKFTSLPVPDGRTICEKQLYYLIDRMLTVKTDHSQIDPFLENINKKLEYLTRPQLIKQFVALEFNRFLQYYKNAPDLNLMERESSPGNKKSRLGRDQVTRFFTNMGKKDNMTPPKIIGVINDATGKRDIEIGKIEILKSFSFFEVDKNYTELILQSFVDLQIKGRKIIAEIATQKEQKIPASHKAGKGGKRGFESPKKWGGRRKRT